MRLGEQRLRPALLGDGGEPLSWKKRFAWPTMRSMSSPRPLFEPVRLGPVELRNRFVRAAAFEGMSQGGVVQQPLIDYHVSVARGGVGMTTVAYASVASEGRSYAHQLDLQRADVGEGLRRLTEAVHAEGAKVALQLGHCGYFSDPKVTGKRPIGASRVFNSYGLSFPRVMSEADIARVVDEFARGAEVAVEAGFDALELHAGHGYLISQFLSPYTNRRKDRYGGGVEQRFRFAAEVSRAVRRVVGKEVALIAKTNLRDGFKGGLDLDEAVQIAKLFEAEALDGLVLSGGFVSKTPMYVMRGDVPFAEFYAGQKELTKKIGLLLLGRVMVKAFPFSEAYFLEDARSVRAAVKMPLMLVGGLRKRETMQKAVDEGFELLALARPLIMEPDFVLRLERGEIDESSCEPCNKCIAEMDKTGMRCVLLDERRAEAERA